MIKSNKTDIDNIHYIQDYNGIRREITYVYQQGLKLWELIIGFLFDSRGRTLKSKDGFILKAKDQ